MHMAADRNVPPLKIAIIGCGAVTELGHLPAAARVDDVQVTALIDKNLPRAESFARRYNIRHVADDFTKAIDKAEAAIVALPHFLHAPVSVPLLQRGFHVLVEKPMAMSTQECDAMIRAAKQGRATLAVGLMRRFQRAAQFTKTILDSQMLGPIESFDIRDGFVYAWPVVSDSMFRKETAGGGVLIDFGSHAIDTMLWWFGDVSSFAYRDDSFGGVEADCELQVVMKNGPRGVVEFSRTRDMRKTAIIRGKHATLEVSLHANRYWLRPTGITFNSVADILSVDPKLQRDQSYEDLMTERISATEFNLI